jgi:hypothetical protein
MREGSTVSEKAILNPSADWDEYLEDSPTPDYGFQRDRNSTLAIAKAPGGSPYSREVANTGHTHSLSWIGLSNKCVRYIKQFYEQYEDDFFTIIDHDGGGRHYVGRFTGNWSDVETANDKYNIQNLTFEEVPSAPMLIYPFNWDRDSIVLRPFDGWGRSKVWLSGIWTTGSLGSNPAVTVITNSGSDSSSFATVEYRGYGFRLYLRKGPAQGRVQVSIDGVAHGGPIDLYDATERGLVMVLEVLALSLDFHRVKVAPTATKNGSSSGLGVSFGYLRVMR